MRGINVQALNVSRCSQKRGLSVFSVDKLCPFVEEITSTLLSQLKPGVAEAEVRELSIDVLVALMVYLSDHDRIDDLKKTTTEVFASKPRSKRN